MSPASQRLFVNNLSDSGACRRLNSNRDDPFALGLFDVARHPGNGPARTNPRNQDVNLSIRLAPNLRTSRLEVNRGICRIYKLVQQHIPTRI
jgi:hypothetical protein